MKNVQVIDGADNCTYDIFSIEDEKFEKVFPNGQDIEFIEDLKKRLSEDESTKLFKGFWDNPVKKSEVNGIHGTIFYELYFKSPFYPTRKDEDMIATMESFAESQKLREF